MLCVSFECSLQSPGQGFCSQTYLLMLGFRHGVGPRAARMRPQGLVQLHRLPCHFVVSSRSVIVLVPSVSESRGFHEDEARRGGGLAREGCDIRWSLSLAQVLPDGIALFRKALNGLRTWLDVVGLSPVEWDLAIAYSCRAPCVNICGRFGIRAYVAWGLVQRRLSDCCQRRRRSLPAPDVYIAPESRRLLCRSRLLHPRGLSFRRVSRPWPAASKAFLRSGSGQSVGEAESSLRSGSLGDAVLERFLRLQAALLPVRDVFGHSAIRLCF